MRVMPDALTLAESESARGRGLVFSFFISAVLSVVNLYAQSFHAIDSSPRRSFVLCIDD